MQTKLGYICDRVIEAGWLAAAVYTPLYFNVYSSRVFEPDKISMLRNIVLMMTIAWFIKLIEGAVNRRAAPRRGVAEVPETEAPGWMPRLFRVPMMLPILLYAFWYLFTTLTSVVPLTSFFGSYQRLQGLISVYTYIMLALLILANMRSRVQLERLITFAIVTSIPVAAYGLLQASGHDPLPWAGDVQTRVASTLGNAIFVAAYLIMVVPLTLQRWIAALAARRTGPTNTPPAPPDPHADVWPLAIIGSGAIFLLMLIQYAGIVTGNKVEGYVNTQPYSPIADIGMWVVVLAAAGLFGWVASRVAEGAGRPGGVADSEPPPVVSALTPVIQLLVLGISLYIVGTMRAPDFSLWIVLPGGIFIFYALTFLYTLAGRTSAAGNLLQVIGLPILLAMQVVVVFLTQSRGPELGLLIGLGVFGYALLLRRRLYRAFAVVLALSLLFGGFLLIFNLPNSPIAAWRTLPYVGRLGLISQTDEGTGKVRTLIWGGALNMILYDPVRMMIGWGPEAMYVGYNKFYPPDLGHWELRNATPDRSHDVFFDQAVTTGLIGLVLYLVLVGSFVWYAIRALRKAPGLHDQLILIGFLSLVVAHVGELVTGIQIVSTYTYFFVAVAGTVVLASVLNNYLPQPAEKRALVGDAADAAAVGPVPAAVPAPARAGNGHGEEAVVGTPARAGAVAVATGGRTNGRPGPGAAGAKKGYAVVTPGAEPPRRPAHPPGVRPAGAPGRITPAGRTPGGPRVAVRTAPTTGYSARRPAFLAAYIGLGLLGLLIAVGLNVNLVKADMFYKQGLAYDGAQQWPGAIGPYQKAIAISPNEDFYYLFIGRAYMEWAKVQSSNPQTFPGSPDAPTLLQNSRNALLTAQSLNPLNTDHYANLGRLYVYWGDAMSDPTKHTPGTSADVAQMYALGVAQYEKAHSLSPGNAGIWNELALAYAKQGRYADAVAAIHGSQQMDNQYAQTPFIGAEIERSQADLLAQQAATKGITATVAVSITQLAQAAAADYATTVKLAPGQLQDGDFERRIAFLQQNNALQPLADAFQTVISQALELKMQDPTSADEPVQARSSLGYIEWKMNKQSDAIVQFERAVALQCDDFYNLQNLATLYRDSGQTEKALNMFQAALAVADCNPADPYVNACAPLKASTQKGSCQPLTGNASLEPTITALRAEVGRLKQQLGRP